jgi:hypothetical protein
MIRPQPGILVAVGLVVALVMLGAANGALGSSVFQEG